MYASKVIITQETRAKISKPMLSPTKKRLLREQMIIDYIGKGCVNSKQELIAAAGLDPRVGSKGYANGLTLINSMLKRGLIAHDGTTKFKKSWVATAVKVSPNPEQVAHALVLAPTYDKARLLQLAKDFTWEKQSDSLRDFISTLK